MIHYLTLVEVLDLYRQIIEQSKGEMDSVTYRRVAKPISANF